MRNKLFPFIFRLLAGRGFFIFLNVISVYFALDGIQFFIKHLDGSVIWGPDGVEELNHVCSGIAGIMVALGVIMESRHVFLRISRTEENDWQVSLNHMAEGFGVVLLILGLFLEVGVIFLEMPDLLFSSKGREFAIYVLTLFLIILSVLVSVSFIIAFLRTYFKNPVKAETSVISSNTNNLIL